MEGQLGGSSRKTVWYLQRHLLYAGLMCHSKFKAKTSLLWRETPPQRPCKSYYQPPQPAGMRAEAKARASPASA